jgi:hypothetical protein
VSIVSSSLEWRVSRTERKALRNLVQLLHAFVLEVRGVLGAQLLRDQDLPYKSSEMSGSTLGSPRWWISLLDVRCIVLDPFNDGLEQCPDGGIVAAPCIEGQSLEDQLHVRPKNKGLTFFFSRKGFIIVMYFVSLPTYTIPWKPMSTR